MKITVLKSSETKNGSFCHTVSVERTVLFGSVETVTTTIALMFCSTQIPDGTSADIEARIESRDNSLPIVYL